MDDTMTIEEIEARFDGEWVLVADPETDEALEVRRGKVLCHSKDRIKFDQQVLEFRPARFAVLFAGEPPADMEFVL